VVDGESTTFAQGPHHGHRLVPIGATMHVEVVVTDRPLDLDVARYGFHNNVGIASGRTAAQQEAYTKRRIMQMQKTAMQQKRQRRVSLQSSEHTQVAGALPSAKFFALRRQYGSSFAEKAKEVMAREGTWWGD